MFHLNCVRATLRLFSTRPRKITYDNQITLIGRVKGRALKLTSGFDSFHVVTASKRPGSLISIAHPIKAKTDNQLPQLNEGTLVYVNGEIAYEKLADDEKSVSIPNILTKKVFCLDNNKQSADLEQIFKECKNEVRLLGKISTDIIEQEKVTIIDLLTHNNLPFQLNTTNFYGGWHRIQVFDDGLREFVRNSLKKSDRIAINGEMSYNNITLNDGKVVTRGWIWARRIQKLVDIEKWDEMEPRSTDKQETGEQTI